MALPGRPPEGPFPSGHTGEASLPGLLLSFREVLVWWRHNPFAHDVLLVCVCVCAPISSFYEDARHIKLEAQYSSMTLS